MSGYDYIARSLSHKQGQDTRERRSPALDLGGTASDDVPVAAAAAPQTTTPLRDTKSKEVAEALGQKQPQLSHSSSKYQETRPCSQFGGTRHEYANTLFPLEKPLLAMAQLDKLLRSDTDNFLHLDLRGLRRR